MAHYTLKASGKGMWTREALRLRNVATYHYAEEFHNTAQKAGSPLTRAYLLGHTIELYLKAYLLKSGLGTTRLASKRHFGHNLEKLLAEAQARGIDTLVHTSQQLSADIAKLNAVYPETLRYFSLLHLLTQPRIPQLARLFRFAGSLRKNLREHVSET